MTYYTINAVGRAHLIDYLIRFLRCPENAVRHAEAVINEFDGSDVGATQDVEISGYYTRDGNPLVYPFDPATELTLNTVDDE